MRVLPVAVSCLLVAFLSLPGCRKQTVRSVCPEGMVWIGGGKYNVGMAHRRFQWQRPMTEVDLAPYCIDRYEYPNREGVKPRHEVSWREASRLCKQAGKRLCTGNEWERACRGPWRWRYPYGNIEDLKACNTPNVVGKEKKNIARSGSFSGCESFDGVHDLNGNLSEWVQDRWNEKWGGLMHESSNEGRTVRGGFLWVGPYGQSCLSAHGHGPDRRYQDDGFRCCTSAAPTRSAP